MKVVADTNVLLRTIVQDDERQANVAQRLLQQATVVAVTLPSFCELAWVLRGAYRLSSAEIAAAIRALLEVSSIVTDRVAVQAGLDLLEKGGDFADGVIAHEGQWLGGETFVSFDRKAVRLLHDQRKPARLLS